MSIKLFCITGDSYTGKTAFARNLVKKYPSIFTLNISYTSRLPREGEVDGIDYHFRDKSFFNDIHKFEELHKSTTKEGEDYYYASLKEDYIKSAKENKIILLIVDAKGSNEFLSKKEINNVPISYNKLMLLDIPTDKIKRFVSKLRYHNNITEDGYSKAIERIGRFDFGKTVKSFNLSKQASIIRNDYYNLEDIYDILKILPSDAAEKILTTLKNKRDGSNHRAYIEMLLLYGNNEKMIYKNIKTNSKEEDFLHISQKYNLDPLNFKNYVNERIEYPLVLLDKRGNSQTYCRMSNQTLVRDCLESFVSLNRNRTYSLDELKSGIMVDVFTPFGTRESVSLSRIAERDLYDNPKILPLTHFGLTEQSLNDALLSTDTYNIEQLSLKRIAEENHPHIEHKNTF